MIYNRALIQISTLCPIQFTEPTEYAFYPEQNNFVPKIETLGFTVQALIDASVFNSNTPFELKCYDTNNTLLKTYTFCKYELSTGIYVAELYFNELPINSENLFVYFQIEQGETILANSVFYKLSPTYTKDIKNMLYWHNRNDFSVVFNVSVTELFLPVVSSWFLSGLITSAKAKIIEDDIVITFASNEGVIPPFDVYFIDKNTGLIHVEYITSTNLIEYVVTVPVSTFSGYEISIFVITDDGSDYIIKSTNFYTIGTTISTTNKLSLDVECGFIPMDSRDEQQAEDYLEQNLVNETLYGDIYEVVPLTIGDSHGITNWLRKKINWATFCDNFTIDGNIYKRTEGSKMEKIEDCENGLATYRIDLQTDINYLQ